jgi:integrase
MNTRSPTTPIATTVPAPVPRRYRSAGSLLATSAAGHYDGQHSEEVATVIANYTPQMVVAHWLAIADFTRSAVTDLGLSGDATYVRHYLKLTARLALWATRTASLDLDRKEIFHPSTIERFILTKHPDANSGSGRHATSILISMSATLTGTERAEFRPRKFERRLADPYSDSDHAWIISWAEGQSSTQQRQAANALVGFCLGAGLRNNEMAAARVEDVVDDAAGLSIAVRGQFARTVPVHAYWEDHARAALRGADADAYLILPGISKRTMLDLVHYARGRSSDSPSARRLRGAWLVRALNLLPPRAAAHFGGLGPLGAAEPFMHFLDDIDFEAAITTLRGTGECW